VDNKRQENNVKHLVGGHQSSSTSSISNSPFRPNTSQRLQGKDLPIELISSPSRGVDSSDSTRDLTNHETQEKYRSYISQRIQSHCDKHGPLLQDTVDDTGLFPITLPSAISPSKWCAAGIDAVRLESLQDILLLIRRLREGCVAAARQDAFTVDVYTLSTLLSLLIGDDIQLASSLPRLIDLLGMATTNTDVAAVIDIQHLCDVPSSKVDNTLSSKAHLASLYLLWLSVLGGQVARIGGGEQRESRRAGGAWFQEKDRVIQCLEKEEQGSRHIKLADDLYSVVAQDNVIELRRILVEERCTAWQRAIVRRSVERLRGLTWTRLTKAYLHVPIDGFLIGQDSTGDDWLERMLFIDVQAMPPAFATIKGEQERVETPDSWDDTSVDQITTALQSTSLRHDNAILQLRSSRLAAIFDFFFLPASPLDPPIDGPLGKWAGRRVMQGGISHIKLR
jgi:hypothetical protein